MELATIHDSCSSAGVKALWLVDNLLSSLAAHEGEGSQLNEQNFMDLEVYNAAFSHAHQELIQERPLTCVKTSIEWAPFPSPGVVVIDVSTSEIPITG